MNKYLLIFFLIAAVLGLWVPPRAKRGVLIAWLTAALVAFFVLSPYKL
jgi:hypothetical protein